MSEFPVRPLEGFGIVTQHIFRRTLDAGFEILNPGFGGLGSSFGLLQQILPQQPGGHLQRFTALLVFLEFVQLIHEPAGQPAFR